MPVAHYFIIILYVSALFMFHLYIKLVEEFEIIWSCLFQELEELKASYDYIVVGYGSAGSVIAHRLSQDKNTTVLVLEAGPSGNSWFDIPAVGPLFQQSSIDWKYKTEPQKNAAKAFNNRVVNWPMGRVVGGSGRINNLVYIRGHPNDFNEWYEGFSDYNFESDVLSYFKKSEKQRGILLNDSKFHGTNGPLNVEDLAFVSPLADAFLKAAKILGYPVRDLNGAYNTGFMQAQVNTNAGQRWTPAHAVKNRNEKNLIIHTNALIHKVLLRDSYEAYAVQFSSLGQMKTICARKAVILSAGAVGTPKILMLSGIGPKSHLEHIGIDVKVDLPVGNNLQDHVATGSDLVLLNTSVGVNPFTMLSPKALFDYFYYGLGPWTLGGCEAVGILDTTVTTNQNSKCKEYCVSKYQKPDLEFMVVPIGASTDGGVHLRKAANINDTVWNKYFVPLIGMNVISILPIVLHPKSRGSVRLLDSSPYSQPLIDPNYLSDPHDLQILLKGIDFIKRIIETTPFQKLGAKFNKAIFPGCEEFDFDSEPYWECYIRHFTITSFHPAGTCKMGKAGSADAVVDYNFAVHNVSKLYVVDASIMPSLPSGNINAAIVMLAEKASDILKWNDYLSTGSCKQYEIFLPKITC